MQVSATDIAAAFQDLISECRSRETIAAWASKIRASDDVEGTTFEPSTSQRAIWAALEFLMGVDLKDGPHTYLHNRADLEEYWHRAKGELVG